MREKTPENRGSIYSGFRGSICSGERGSV